MRAFCKHLVVVCSAVGLSLAACSSRSEDVDGTSGAATTAPAITPGPFMNAEDTLRCDVEGIVVAKSVADVQQAVRFAAARNRTVKVTSAPRGAHSGNTIICPEKGDLVIDVRALRSIAVDAPSQRVVVGPAATIEEVNEQLAAEGLGLSTMPDYTGISIAGAIATSAHGSSLTIPSSLSAYVEGMKIVDGTGTLRELSGDALRAGAVHGGWFGAVVEVTLRAEPLFKVRYDHDTFNDADIATKGIDLAKSHDYARIHWFPEHDRYVVDYFDRRPLTEPGEAYNDSWRQTGLLAKVTGQIPSLLLNDSPTEDLQCTISAVRSAWWVSTYTNGGLFKAPVGISYKMMGGTCAAGDCAWEAKFPSKTRSVEVAFPLDRFAEWSADIKSLIQKARGCFPLFGIYLRFSSGTNLPLDMAEGGPTVLAEIHVLQNVSPSRFENSNAVYDEIQQLTIAKYAGRPHWGKNESPAFIGVGPRNFSQWATFEKERRLVDPQGVFSNALLRHVRDSDPVAGSPGCVSKRECICSADSDCGPGYSCAAGAFFKDARVCRKAEGRFCARDYDCASGSCVHFKCASGE